MELNKSRAHLLCLALLALVCGIAEAHRWGKSAFPFEGCRQMIGRKQSYQAIISSYDELSSAEARLCYKIVLVNITLCNIGNRYPTNDTRCCESNFDKIKFWPAQECRGSISRVTYQRTTDSEPIDRAWNMQTMSPVAVKAFTKSWHTQTPKNGNEYEPQWVYKIENFMWTREEANQAEICIYIGKPCPTMETFAFNGEQLEFLLYDKKEDNYECCVPGLSDVLSEKEYKYNATEPCPHPWVLTDTEVCHAEWKPEYETPPK